MKLTIEQWKKANSVLRKSVGYRNANVLVPDMLDALGIKYSYDKENGYFITIDKSQVEDAFDENIHTF